MCESENRNTGRETVDRNPYHPVIVVGDRWNVLDLTKGYHPESITLDPPSIGRYNEKRTNMYVSGLFKGVRNIHMGIDIWVPAGSPVYAFADGKVLFFRDNNNPGDYGPTIVAEHKIDPFDSLHPHYYLYALFGHLSRSSLQNVTEGMPLKRGQCFAQVGEESENGGWVPHLHFQLSLVRPDEPDMPGVVADEDHERALKMYPDPGHVLGRFY